MVTIIDTCADQSAMLPGRQADRNDTKVLATEKQKKKKHLNDIHVLIRSFSEFFPRANGTFHMRRRMEILDIFFSSRLFEELN